MPLEEGRKQGDGSHGRVGMLFMPTRFKAGLIARCLLGFRNAEDRFETDCTLPCMEEERKQMLRCKEGAPFILGWGQDTELIPLARQCLSRIEGGKTVTVPARNNPVLTAHPSPMLQAKKEAWLLHDLARRLTAEHLS